MLRRSAKPTMRQSSAGMCTSLRSGAQLRCKPASPLEVACAALASFFVFNIKLQVNQQPALGLFSAGYVQELNMHGGLYAALVRALEPHGTVSGPAAQAASGQAQDEQIPDTRDVKTCGNLSVACGEAQEAQRVGRALRRDMERAGIHLAGAARARLEVLSARTHELGLVFGARQALFPLLWSRPACPASQRRASAPERRTSSHICGTCRQL